MGRVMYFDCFSGAAGDMVLGALIDAGLPLADLERALGSLAVGHTLTVRRVVRAGLTATHVTVEDDARPEDARADPSNAHGHPPQGSHDHHQHAGHHHHHAGHAHEHAHHHEHGHDAHGHRTLAEINHLIDHSALSAAGKTRAKALFRRLGEAEAAVHNVPLDQVHLHEVGAVDSIIDIVGAVFGLEWFGIDDIVVSPINVGGGTVQIAHGRYPVPAPATARLLDGVPIHSSGPQVELLTPTGALLMSAYATSYGALPAMTVQRVGYGAGSRDFADVPNVLRVVIGERPLSDTESRPALVLKIECEIDDMSPQLFAPAMDRLFAAGAVDVFLTAVQMKKGRPGTLVTVLTTEDRREAICDVLFRETTTIGIRFARMERDTLARRWVNVDVPGGTVRIKLATRGDEILNAAPEFDDCAAVAAAAGRSVKTVMADALRAWQDAFAKGRA